MTAVADVKLVIETLIGRTLTNDQLNRIGDRLLEMGGYTAKMLPTGVIHTEFTFNLPQPVIADPLNPTAEEKAQYAKTLLAWVPREFVKAIARRETQSTFGNVITAAESAAADDIS